MHQRSGSPLRREIPENPDLVPTNALVGHDSPLQETDRGGPEGTMSEVEDTTREQEVTNSPDRASQPYETYILRR